MNNTLNYIAMVGFKSKVPIVAPQLNSGDIEYIVSEYYNVPFGKLHTKARHRPLVFPRQVIMYLIRRFTSDSLKITGERFGRDHTTAIHAINTVKNLMTSDPKIKDQIAELEDRIYRYKEHKYRQSPPFSFAKN